MKKITFSLFVLFSLLSVYNTKAQTNPVITCPPDVVVSNDYGLCSAIVSFDDATATDVEDGMLPTIQTLGLPSGSAFPVGETIIEFSATDSDNNTVSCQFTITVLDEEAPILTCPGNLNEPTNNDGVFILHDYVAIGEVSATDNCDGFTSITFTQSPVPGTPLGINTSGNPIYIISFTAEDTYGNISECDFELLVINYYGVSDLYNQLNEALSIYPNPTSGEITLQNDSDIKLNQVVVYDINNKQLAQIDLKNMQQKKNIDVSKFASGFYWLKVLSDNVCICKPFLIER